MIYQLLKMIETHFKNEAAKDQSASYTAACLELVAAIAKVKRFH